MKRLPHSLSENLQDICIRFLCIKFEQPTALKSIVPKMIPRERKHLVRQPLVHLGRNLVRQQQPVIVRRRQEVHEIDIWLFQNPAHHNALVNEYPARTVPVVQLGFLCCEN